MKERKRRTRVMCLLATAVFLSLAAAPVVCEGSESVLKTTQVQHDTSLIKERAPSFAPPYKDIITISGVTNPKAEVNGGCQVKSIIV